MDITRVSKLCNEFISNFIVSGSSFLSYFFTNFHREVSQAFAYLVRFPPFAVDKKLLKKIEYGNNRIRQNQMKINNSHTMPACDQVQFPAVSESHCGQGLAKCNSYLTAAGAVVLLMEMVDVIELLVFVVAGLVLEFVSHWLMNV